MSKSHIAHEALVALVRQTSTLPGGAGFERTFYGDETSNPEVANPDGYESWNHFLYRLVETATGGPGGSHVEIDGEALRLFVLEDVLAHVKGDQRDRVRERIETNQYYREVSAGPVRADSTGGGVPPVRTVYGAGLSAIGSNTYD